MRLTSNFCNSAEIDLIVQDQIGTTTFALRNEVAAHFYEEHLRTYEVDETVSTYD